MSLQGLFAERFTTALTRKAVRTCSKWAETYRIMGAPFPGKWSFDKFPWLREIHNSSAIKTVVQKSAQAGVSETALNKVLYHIDVKAQSVLYVLPNKTPDAADFSSSRFNQALEESEYLRKIFNDVNNVGLKRAGSASLYVRGSRSRSALKSIPVSLLILDEMDEMTQKNIPLVLQRLSGQPEKETWIISTPTTDDTGVNLHYQQTTQEHFHFECPSCSRLTELTYPECLVVTAESVTDKSIENSYIKCKECNNALPHEQKQYWLSNNIWVPAYPDRIERGFHINQMYSSTVSPAEIANKAILAQSNEEDEQELYNSVLGLTKTTKSARVEDSDLFRCTKGYRQPPGLLALDWSQLPPGSFGPEDRGKPQDLIITLGIDVGKFINFEFDAWVPCQGRTADPSDNAFPILLKADKCRNIEEIYSLIDFFRPNAMVIDAGPERRFSYNFCLRYHGKAHMCMYIEGVSGKHFKEDDEDDEKPVYDEPLVKVDRTSWLDLSQGRFKAGTIHLPQNLQTEYKDHIKTLVRTPKRDRNQNISYHYVQAKNNPDHYAHARNYAEIAYPLAIKGGSYRTIEY